MVGLSKFISNSKLLIGVIPFIITLGVISTQLYIYIYMSWVQATSGGWCNSK